MGVPGVLGGGTVSVILDNPIAIWAALLILLLPVLIVAAGEVQERLRQRESQLEGSVATVRNWVLPLGVAWVLVVLVFEVDRDSFLAQALATGMLVALASATLQAIAYFVDIVRRRSEVPGARGVPQLLLLLPRLIVFLATGWLIVESVWNIDVSGFFAALGVTSLIISLALQPTLSGIASGLLLVSDRPFEPGDWIRAGDIEGQVMDLGWRTSKVRDRNGDVVVIPNSKLSEATLHNYAEPNNLHRVVVPVQVAFANPPTSAIEMLLAAARATPGVLDDPPPSVRVVQIDDPLMGYEADLWIDDFAIAPRVFSDFGALVWYHSERMGVPLPSPAYDIFHHDPVQEAADAEIGPPERRERLRSVPYLADLADEDVATLAADAAVVRFQRGETIVRPGITDRRVFILWEGRARITDPDRPTSFVELGPGDLFGLLSRTRDRTPPAVSAETDCEVMVLDEDAVGVVASRNPALAEAVRTLAANRLRRLEDRTDEESLPRIEGDALTDPDAASTTSSGEEMP